MTSRRVTVLTFAAAVVFALVLRGGAAIGIALLFVVFVPLEKLFAFRKQTRVPHRLAHRPDPHPGERRGDRGGGGRAGRRRRHPGVLDPTLRPGGRAARRRSRWGWRWRWSRSATTGATASPTRCRSCGGSTPCTTASSRWTGSRRAGSTRSTRRSPRRSRSFPLFLLGYGAGVFGGVAVFITLLALFQHANVRLRFPGLRWVINTPEWHHWHHAIDDDARDKNFGLPVVDKIFGTAYLPKDRRPVGFGTRSPVPADGLPAAPRLPVHARGEGTHHQRLVG